MISKSNFENYKNLSAKLADKSEWAIIILDNINGELSYRMNFSYTTVPQLGGIRLQVKDQKGRDLLTDGFLVEDKVITWVFEEIEKHLGLGIETNV